MSWSLTGVGGVGGTNNMDVTDMVNSWTVHIIGRDPNAPGSGINSHMWALMNNSFASSTYYATLIWDSTSAGTRFAIQMRNTGGTLSTAKYTSTASANTWYYMGARLSTASSGTLSAWLNGTNEASTTGVGAMRGSLTNVAPILGAIWGYVSPNDGDIAEFCVWNTELTDDEMVALGKGVCPLLIRPDAIKLYVPLRNKIHAELNKTSVTFSQSGAAARDEHPEVLYPRSMQVGFPSVSYADVSVSAPVTVSTTMELPTVQMWLDVVADAGVSVVPGYIYMNITGNLTTANATTTVGMVLATPIGVTASADASASVSMAIGITMDLNVKAVSKSIWSMDVDALATGRFRTVVEARNE